MPSLSITSVKEVKTESSSHVRLDGLADGCVGVTVDVWCSRSSKIREHAEVVDGRWSLLLETSGKAKLRCPCGSPIKVLAACSQFSGVQDTYSGLLECADEPGGGDNPGGGDEPGDGGDEPGGGDGTGRCGDAPPFEVCAPITEAPAPPLRVSYRGHVLDASLAYTAADDTRGLLACNALSGATLHRAAEYEIVQTWHFQSLTRGEVAAVLPMAPGEKLSVRVRRSQRTQFKTSTVDSKEEMRSFESSISDKEVMEAMRALTKNQQWSVSATAGVNAGPVSASVTAGYQESVQRNSSTKLQQVHEATEKASNQLRTLNKIEVTRSTDTETEDERVRQLVNPYRDRSLSLAVYELHKRYCVDHVLETVRPALMLEMPGFVFDRAFVLANVQFLTRSLLDELLLGDLQSSLSAAQRPADLEGDEGRANDMAALALRHLLEDDLVLPFRTGMRVIMDGFPPSEEPIRDDPEESFVEPEHMASGWSDAQNKEDVNELFLLLASFRHLRTELEERSSLAEIVIALAEQVKAVWTQIEPGTRMHLYDTRQRTAVFRRIPAFLALVDKFLRPLLQGPEFGGDGGFDGTQRAGLVIGRVVTHLNCHAGYYAEQFHAYLHELTRGAAYRDFFFQLVGRDVPASEHDLFFRDFDVDRAYLSGTWFVVPYQGLDARALLGRWFPDDPLGSVVEPLRLDVTLPADGAHIEAVAGRCVLAGVPPPLPDDVFDAVHLVVDPDED